MVPPQPSPKSEFMRGMKEVVPVLFGMLPFALILGVQGAKKGMSVLEMPLMTGLNFAGGSEFAAVGLWGDPLPVLLIIGVTFMINTRHILMGAAMAPYLRHLPMKKALGALFFMTDESWALGMAFPAVFLVLLRGMWKGFKATLPWLVSLIAATAVYLTVDGAWYVPAGALAGLATAYLTEESA